MKKYGFFGGAFNPPTFAHINLAKQALIEFDLDKVFFVPVGNTYKKDGLIDEIHRFNMLKEITYNENNFDVLDIELNKNIAYKAIDIFNIIKNEYPNDVLYFLMGGDNFDKISTWKSANELIKNFKFIIFDRDISHTEILENNMLLMENKDNFHFIENTKYKEINSKSVREHIKNNQDVSIYIPKEIIEYIRKNNLYK